MLFDVHLRQRTKFFQQHIGFLGKGIKPNK